MAKDSCDGFYRPFFCGHLNRERNFESLQIPNEFLHKITEEVPDTATLRGPGGGSWPVKVHEKYNGIFLVEGWQKFHMDHSLISGGFLLFRYCGKWCFDVEIYGRDGVENMKIQDEGKGGNGLSLEDQATESPPANSGAPKDSASRASWKCPHLLEFYLDLCVEEAALKRTEGGNLNKGSWENIQLAFKEVKGIDVTTVQLKNHWSFLKKRYMVWLELIVQANSQYDPATNTINWDKKQWEKYVQKHPEAKLFRKRPLEYPAKMRILFDN